MTTTSCPSSTVLSHPSSSKTSSSKTAVSEPSKTSGLCESQTAFNYDELASARDRLKAFGSETLSDTELIALFIARVHTKRDALSCARLLIERFGSLSGVFAANEDLLRSIDGLDPTFVDELKLHIGISGRILGEQLFEKPLIKNIASVITYCRTLMAYNEREEFRVLFLNKKKPIDH